MANTRELRRRIKSVKNTAQITKAMQMVAATKMRRAQSQALNGRPYTFTLNSSLLNLLPKIKMETHPLLGKNNSDSKAVLLLTTDKSLCGALNTNVLRATNNFIKETKELMFYTVGKKGRLFVVKLAQNLVADFENMEKVEFRQARQIAKMLVTSFMNGEIGEVYIAYPHFGSALRQEPKIVKILPISYQELSELSKDEVRTGARTDHLEVFDSEGLSPQAQTRRGGNQEFIFEPSATMLLDYILYHTIDIKIYQALLETKASEHSARMMAMQNATDNAKELVCDLQLTYNQTRQASITTELLEITSAQAALS